MKWSAKAAVIGLVGLASFSSGAWADVTLSLGYYDLPPPAGGNTNPLPDPWLGSPNTTFLGDTTQASSSDPDESALLVTNNGLVSVTLNQGFTITSGSNTFTLWDSLIGPSGLVIQPGANVILSGTNGGNLDGSDIPLTDSTISLSLDGILHSVEDSQSILEGSPIGSANETISWTQVADITSVPEPGTWWLGIAFTGAAVIMRSRKKAA
jgi:hypothetical protein